MTLSRSIWAMFGLALAVSAPTQAYAQSYGLRDAVHVTDSKNIDVLSYVVCLKEESDKQPRRMALREALEQAVRECRSDAVNLPAGRNDPSAEDIKLSILECGFEPGDASADAACDGDGPLVRADTIRSVPTLIDTGKWLEGISYDGKDIWAAESGQRTTAQIDFNSGRVVERHKVGRLPIEVATDGSGETYTLVATDQKILVHDRRGRTSTLTDLADYPKAMALDGDALWVLASPGGSSDNSVVIRVDALTGKQAQSRNLGEWSTDLLVLNDEVWVSHARRAEISIVDKSRLRASVVSLPNADIWKLTTDYNYVYGAGRTSETSPSGLVVKINPITRQEEGRVELSEMIMEVVSDGTFVYAIGESGKIWIISAVDMQVQRLVEAQTAGASFAPTGAMLIEDLLVVAARQFYDVSGDPIKDSRRKDDENGAILLFGNILPDGNFAMTAPPVAGGRNAGPTRPTTRPTATRPTTSSQAPTRPSSTRNPARPNSSAQQPTRPNSSTGPRTTRPTVGNGPRNGNNLPRRPTSTTSSSAFPVTAGSRGGNVRETPSANGRKIGSTGEGQPVTLLQNTGKMYQGYPWFRIKMADGTLGYQWGGGTCAYPRRPVQGTKGTCERATISQRPTSNGNRPNSNGNSGQKADGVDVAIKVLDIFGKLLDGANQADNINRPNRPNNGQRPTTAANPNVFTQTLQVAPNGQGVIASRTVSQGKVALYTIRGKRGQTLDVNVWSPSNNAVFEIYVGEAYKGGATMPGAAANANTQDFNGVLPDNTTYKIAVGSVDGDAEFQLVVTLEPATNASVASSGSSQVATSFPSSGGSVADNRLAVGTYISTTGGPTGNIELDEATNTLTWTEFCSSSHGLTANWSFGNLMSDIGDFQLDISNAGEVTGFTFSGNSYTKENGIMMPGCVAAPTGANASQAVDWTQDPQDSRADNDYSAVPNAYWQICESANYDQNSPDFNNETAYWNCAEAGVAVGTDNDAAYDNVQPDAQQNCLSQSQFPSDPRQDPDYNACMQQAEMNALEAQEDATIADEDAGAAATADPRSAKTYETVAAEAWNACWELQSNGELAVYDCLDAAEQEAAAAADPRSVKTYETVSAETWNTCWELQSGGEAAVYDCLDAAENEAAIAGAISTGPDLNPGGLYSALEEEVLQACQGDISCLDAAVSQAGRAEAQAIDYRIANEFNDLTEDDIRQCDNADYGSEGFFNCLESVRANKPNPAETQEPGSDRANVLYQPAHDHCVGLGYVHGSTEYGECYYAYPDYQASEAQTDAMQGAQPTNDDPTGALGQIQNYCEGNYGDDEAARCYEVGAACFASFPDLNSSEFGACTEGW